MKHSQRKSSDLIGSVRYLTYWFENLEDWFRVELTYTSNAIEGNTLTRRETALVVEKGLTVGGRSLIEHLEATNHVSALDWVQAQVHRKPWQPQAKRHFANTQYEF